MICLALPSSVSEPQRLPFYLAMEEWAACCLPAGDWFFTWRVDPTVIFGRNQMIDTEVDMDYCRSRGIAVYRRRSGGGCVYADRDNIMLSYVSYRPGSVTSVFAAYTEQVAGMLRKLGLDATATGRNDVCIGERKVSGGAFYRMAGRNIVHSTMLFATDMENMLRAITPSRSKLESKQVRSVASRLTTVSEHLPGMRIEDFNAFMIQSLAPGEPRVLTDSEVEQIRSIENAYYTPAWIYGARRSGRWRRSGRIEGVGEMTASIELEPDGLTVRDISLDGDYFLLDDLDEGLLSHLRGVAFTREDFAAALEGCDVGATIPGLDSDALLNLLF